MTIAINGLPQEAADLHVARARADALRGAFDDGARMLDHYVIEQFSNGDIRGNRARLADLVKKDIKRFTLDLCKASDVCGHGLAYPPGGGCLPGHPGAVLAPLPRVYIQRWLDKRRRPPTHRCPHRSGWRSGGRVPAMGKKRHMSVWCRLRVQARRLCSRGGERH